MSDLSDPAAQPPVTERERLLAQFQRKTAGTIAATPGAAAATTTAPQLTTSIPVGLSADAETYDAFKPVDRRRVCLHIRPASEPWQWVKYGYMTQIVADQGGTRLDVSFPPFLLVTITGRNLLEVGDALADERCDFIQQFDAAKWPKPADGSAPFIEFIGYMTNQQDQEEEEAA